MKINAAYDPSNTSLYRLHRGVGPLASEHAASCGHAIPVASVGDALPGTIPDRVQPGDVWRSDTHWVICADSTDPSVITATKLIGKPSVLIWDPPFDLDVPAPSWAQALPAFVFTNNDYLQRDIERWGSPRHILTWDTAGVDTGQFSRDRTAPLRTAKHCLAYSDTYNPNGDVWDRAVMHGDDRHGRAELTDTYRLPLGAMPLAPQYQKPVDWIRRIIGCLSPGGLIIDPFAGTGTTLVAAQQLQRPCIAIEITPDLASTALARIEAWTGTPAVKVATVHTLASAINLDAEQQRADQRRARDRQRLMQRIGRF